MPTARLCVASGLCACALYDSTAAGPVVQPADGTRAPQRKKRRHKPVTKLKKRRDPAAAASRKHIVTSSVRVVVVVVVVRACVRA